MSAGPIRKGQIAAANVRPAVDASRAFGLPVSVLRDLGLHDLDDTRVVSGPTTVAHFAWVASHLTGADRGRFVVDAAQRHTLSSLGAVGMLCRASRTVAEALAQHGRFQHLTNRTARYVLQTRDDQVHLVEERYGPASPGSRWLSDYTVLVAVQLLRQVGVADVPVLRAESRRACIDPEERSVLEAFLGAPLRSGFESASLVLDAEVLARPLPTADPEIAEFLEARLALAGPEPLTVTDRVREVLVECWTRGRTATAVAVGRQLGMSTRTLHRRLADEGRTFAGVRDGARCELSVQLLNDHTLALVEVAVLVGYRDETSFWRAFRRWTGRTPAEYRAFERDGDT